MALTGLKKISGRSKSKIFGVSSVKMDLLGLGCACASSPWIDGSASSILDQLRMAATNCITGDPNVVAAANTALRLCDSLTTPRVPALQVVKHSSNFNASETKTSCTPPTAETLLQDLQNAESDTLKAARAADNAAQEEAASMAAQFEQKSSKRKRTDENDEDQRTRQRSSHKGLLEGSRTESTEQIKADEIVDTNDHSDLQDDQNAHPQDEAGTPLPSKDAVDAEPTDASSTANENVPSEEVTAKDKDKTNGSDEDNDFIPGIVDDGPDEDDI